jgi:hypothetical protein
MKELHEKQELNYDGTIIDIETIGDTTRGYPKYDSREFNQVKIVIFGFINKNGLHIYCAEGMNDIDHLAQYIKATITPDWAKPLFAYNAHYEMGTIFHHYGIELPFDFELQPREYLRKEDYMQEMGIVDNCNDPFNFPPNRGLQCRTSWQNSHFDQAMRHNRACLLKEQAIMLTKTFKPIIPFTFNTELAKPQTDNIRYWSYTEEKQCGNLWNEGKTISDIATKLNRSPKAIWMRLQKLGYIPQDKPHDNDKNNFTKDK